MFFFIQMALCYDRNGVGWSQCDLCEYTIRVYQGTIVHYSSAKSTTCPLQVPIARDLYGLILPNIGIGFALGMW